MNVLPVGPLVIKISIGTNLFLRDLWELSGDVEGEGSELLNVHTFACSQILIEVFN